MCCIACPIFLFRICGQSNMRCNFLAKRGLGYKSNLIENNTSCLVHQTIPKVGEQKCTPSHCSHFTPKELPLGNLHRSSIHVPRSSTTFCGPTPRTGLPHQWHYRKITHLTAKLLLALALQTESSILSVC